ncbi:LysM peptidoglycan-binding domain-containing protein [Halalkalibacter alkalisediminis]|uniref:LysM peptidoglycan-binding domain-containing protein n=1 Tax=Halalkalibacter alkalisediminis TaxID=935616 RepID=A0ABV6NES8_9BACI
MIAARFGVSLDALRSANQLRSDLLQMGQVLVIPEKQTESEPTQTEQRSTFTIPSLQETVCL